MNFIPSARDETLALNATLQTALNEKERDICTVIALAANAQLPVFPETLQLFRDLVARSIKS